MYLLFKHCGENGETGLNAPPHATMEYENDTSSARGITKGRLLQLRQNVVQEKLLNRKNIAMTLT